MIGSGVQEIRIRDVDLAEKRYRDLTKELEQ
jgi:hypothetical protein